MENDYSVAAYRVAAIRAVTRVGNQSDMARRLGITRQAWFNYESGTQRMGLDVAIAIRKAWLITLDWIYLGERGGMDFDLVAALTAAYRAAESGEKSSQSESS